MAAPAFTFLHHVTYPYAHGTYDIFVNCKWLFLRWQLYKTHLHTNNTQNDTKQTIHRTTQNLRVQKFWNRWAVPRLGELYPDIRLTTEEKSRKNLSQGSLHSFKPKFRKGNCEIRVR